MNFIDNSIKHFEYKYDKKDEFYWNDKKFVLEAIKIDKWCLCYASEQLQNDREIIIEHLKNYEYSFVEYAPGNLQNGKYIIFESIKFKRN